MEKKYKNSRKLEDGSEIYFKTFECEDLKVSENELVFIGYANTKNKADAYGDIPTNYQNKPVYDLSRFRKNPVMLLDHTNSLAMVMGKFVRLEEDEKGLLVELALRPLEDVHNPLVKDAISAFKGGFGRALSIGGRWFFEDPENPAHLTKAYIHEISGVGVGADAFAIVKPKSAEGQEAAKRTGLEALIKAFRETGDKALIPIIQQKKNELTRSK